MKKSLILGICVILTLSFGCESSDGKKAQISYDHITKSFEIEEKAEVCVAVPTSSFGEALKSLWAEKHPKQTDVLSYEVVSGYDARYYLLHDDIDLIYISEEELPLLLKNTMRVDSNVYRNLNVNEAEQNLLHPSVLNGEETVFFAMESEGYYWFTDFALLEKAGVDITDADGNNLPDSLDTFEEILAFADNCDPETIFCIYPLQFAERSTFYPILTAGGWQMYSGMQSSDPGFRREEFKTSLEFIGELGRHLFYPAQPLSSLELPYVYDQALIEGNSVFSLANPAMYREFEKEGADIRFSRFPSWKENILTPLHELKGYAISADCPYPNCALEVLKLILSHEGLQAFLDNTGAIACLDPERFDVPDDYRAQMMKAAGYSISEPLIALKSDTAVRAFDMYYESGWFGILRPLFDQEITASAAQEEIARLTDQWLLDHNETLPEEESDAEQ